MKYHQPEKDEHQTERQPQKGQGFKSARGALTMVGGHDVINWHVLLLITEEIVVNERRPEKDHCTQERYHN